MYPTLFSIGRLSVQTYTVVLDLGLILGLVLVYAAGRRALLGGETALEAGLWAIVAGIIGGRLGYTVVNWPAFQDDPLRVLRIWEGGLAFHAAFFGGFLALLIFAWFHGYDAPTWWRLLDLLTPGIAVAVVFGWAACLFAGCAYGAVGEGIGYLVLPDLYGVAASRFVTQIAGMVYGLLLLAGVVLLRDRSPFLGAIFLLYVTLYFAGHFFLGFTRGDEAVYAGPWRLGQVLDLAYVFAAAVVLLARWWEANQPGDDYSSTS
jgi:phosphatidylglycerol:prolipoprotein diacylglycerol transferase